MNFTVAGPLGTEGGYRRCLMDSYAVLGRRIVDEDEPGLLWPEEDQEERLLIRRWFPTRHPAGTHAELVCRQGALPGERCASGRHPLGPRGNGLAIPGAVSSTSARSHSRGSTWRPGWITESFRPPLLADPYRTDSVQFALCVSDAWDSKGPPLTMDDERGVEIQRRARDAMITAARQKHQGEDPVITCDCSR